MKKYSLKLFLYLVNPKHPELLNAVNTLRDFLGQELDQNFELEVIDVMKDPAHALKEGVFATPTLLRSFPLPPLRMVGDFTNRQMVLSALELEK